MAYHPHPQRVLASRAHPLHHGAATRLLEAAASAALAPHTLMQRAGAAVASLARALAPHARTVWIACGKGNNGGDGLEAAALLQRLGDGVRVSLLARPDELPADARHSWQHARDAGVPFIETPPRLESRDLCIDALLGIGLRAAPDAHASDPRLLQWLGHLRASEAAVLSVDVPSGLLADSGQWAAGLAGRQPAAGARHTLSLLTLHPGLFTAQGRDAAGEVWFEDLGVDAAGQAACAVLGGAAPAAPRMHASHKGSFGDVAVIGGEGLAARGMGMTGAAILAALAALHGGAGRVLLAPLDESVSALSAWPELMLRRPDTLDLAQATLVCGCGGGQAIGPHLSRVLEQATRLVLDADALNAVAADTALQALLRARQARANHATVLTPHPLEAARLLGCSSAQVQSDRLGAAAGLVERFGRTVVLKGSGSLIAAPGQTPHINPTGNARLATAGTGDVLAGLIGAHLAALHAPTQEAVHEAASRACWQHGAVADHWPPDRALTARALAQALGSGPLG